MNSAEEQWDVIKQELFGPPGLFHETPEDMTKFEECKAVLRGHSEAKDQRLATLEAMLDEAVGIFGRYLNVPESRDLKDRWEKLKTP